MTLDDLKRQVKVLLTFCDFGLRHTFLQRIVPKSLHIGQNSLHMKFSTLNVVFISLHFGPPLCSKNPPYGGVELRYPSKCAFAAARTTTTAARDRLRYLVLYLRKYSLYTVY